MFNKQKIKLLTLIISLNTFAFPLTSQASSLGGSDPSLNERNATIVANVYEKDGNEYSSILVNDKIVYTVKTNYNSEAQARVEAMAQRLANVIHELKGNANNLMPGQDTDSASIKLGNQTVFKFDTAELDENNGNKGINQSFQIVNSIRMALGVNQLPQSILGFLNKASKDASQTMGKISNCFNGLASWYGGKFEGRKTSNGDIFNGKKLTAAHPSLPFGTKLLVVNRKTGDSCIVEVNDRGPFVGKRVIDLSKAAAKQLNMLSNGVAMVDCMVLDKD